MTVYCTIMLVLLFVSQTNFNFIGGYRTIHSTITDRTILMNAEAADNQRNSIPKEITNLDN